MMETYFRTLLCGFTLFVSLVLQPANTLSCYSCYDTGPGSRCNEYNTYLQAWENNDSKILKNCTSPHDVICYIETYQTNGHEVSQIRDCNSGSVFSFTSADKPERYRRLVDLTANNETACVWDSSSLVCLTKCNTDFCNGPLETEVNSAPEMTLHLLLMATIAMLHYFR